MPDLNPAQFRSLGELKQAGYVTDEWRDWQQGGCGTYAHALIQEHPRLRAGALFDDEGIESHFFAHDGVHAYDSAGKHKLPYMGVHGQAHRMSLDEDLDWYGEPQGMPEDVERARAHVRRHGIGAD